MILESIVVFVCLNYSGDDWSYEFICPYATIKGKIHIRDTFLHTFPFRGTPSFQLRQAHDRVLFKQII